MAVLAVVSQFSFAYAFSIPLIPSEGELLYQYVNVIWGLLWALLALTVIFHDSLKVRPWMKLSFWLIAVVITIPADFMCVGVLAAPLMYRFRDKFWIKIGILSLFSFMINFICTVYWTGNMPLALLMGSGALLIVPLFRLYNGRRGSWVGMKWFYYCFYPVHLYVIGLIAHLM